MISVKESTVDCRSYAKLNLRLKVLGRRADGYHLLSMLNVLIDFFDDLKLTLTDTPGITCAFAADQSAFDGELNNPEKNLAARAAAIILNHINNPVGVEISAHKRIPVGGGLGGGSSNAATVFNKLPELLLTANIINKQQFAELQQLAKECAVNLGADIPYFMMSTGGLTQVAGVGEQVDSFPSRVLDNVPVAVLLSNQGMASKDVYNQLRKDLELNGVTHDSQLSDTLGKLLAVDTTAVDSTENYSAILKLVENDLLSTFLALRPEYAQCLQALSTLDIGSVSLSGSGSSFFILPQHRDGFKPELHVCFEEIAEKWGLQLIFTRILAI